jgi:hypothetical protein
MPLLAGQVAVSVKLALLVMVLFPIVLTGRKDTAAIQIIEPLCTAIGSTQPITSNK